LDPEPTWALRRLFLGPAEQPLQPEEPLLEELVAHVSHRQRGRRSQGGLQADAYSGYNELYDPARPQGPITAAFCARPLSPSRSIICCDAGIGLPDSSTMAGSA
jgi:hypothetical protein